MALPRSTNAALVAALVALLALAVGAGPAVAAPRPWATINVCDTPRQPNALGVRGSMPGNGTGQRMSMRFRVQYLDPYQGRFVDLGGALRSPWVRAGSARFRRGEAGYTFRLNPPLAGQSYILRARVEFRWHKRRGRRLVVVRRARAVTEAGHRAARGGDPRGYSAATCELR